MRLEANSISGSQKMRQVTLRASYNSISVADENRARSSYNSRSSTDEIRAKGSFNCSSTTDDNRASTNKDMERQADENDCLSSQDLFCTPDFVTPVENQFHIGFGESSVETKRLQSPVSLTPLRAKRPRVDDNNSDVLQTWTGEDILSTQPEPPRLKLPSHRFPPNLHLQLAPSWLPRDEETQSSEPEESRRGLPLEQGERGDNRTVLLTPRTATENIFARPEPPKQRSNLESLQAGHQAVVANVRDRIARMRRGVHSPPCMPNPFLQDEQDEGRTEENLRNRRSLIGSMPTTKSRFSTEFYEMGEIGRGYFSRVLKVRQRIDGCLYAVKRTIKELKQDSERRKAITEVQALAAVGCHENVVRYFSAWYESDHLYIQMELCEGSLTAQLSGKPVLEKDLIDILQQMARALSFIHSKGIVHLDLKPDNIYASNGGYKLGDFGLATRLDGSMSVIEGDARYMPLEVLNNDYSDLTKTDMFSLGASVYELASGCPLPSTGPPFKAIRDGSITFLMDFSSEFQEVVKALLHRDPKLRPSADDLLKHPLLTKQ